MFLCILTCQLPCYISSHVFKYKHMSYLTLHVVMFIPIYPSHIHVIMFPHNVTPTLFKLAYTFATTWWIKRRDLAKAWQKMDIKPQVNHGGKWGTNVFINLHVTFLSLKTCINPNLAHKRIMVTKDMEWWLVTRIYHHIRVMTSYASWHKGYEGSHVA